RLTSSDCAWSWRSLSTRSASSSCAVFSRGGPEVVLIGSFCCAKFAPATVRMTAKAKRSRRLISVLNLKIVTLLFIERNGGLKLRGGLLPASWTLTNAIWLAVEFFPHAIAAGSPRSRKQSRARRELLLVLLLFEH